MVSASVMLMAMTTLPAGLPGLLAKPEDAIAHFRARLSFETDVSDVRSALTSGQPGLVVVDTRNEAAWEQGHVPGAVHLPTAEIATRAAEIAASGDLVIAYCWGPGCNGATRGALAFALAGYTVKEMLGGFEYWVREGLPVETAEGTHQRDADALTAVGANCAC